MKEEDKDAHSKRRHPDVCNIDPKEIFASRAAHAMDVFEKKFDPATTLRCKDCWFHKKGCICSQCPPSLCISLPFETIVLIHPTELFRASCNNTAKTLLWWGARRCVFGHEEDMAYLEDRFRTTRTAILYPSDQASEPSSDVDIDTIVVLDGTWSTARTMHKACDASVVRWKLDLERSERDTGYGRTRKYDPRTAPKCRGQTGHAYCELLRILNVDDDLVDQMVAHVQLSTAEYVRQNSYKSTELGGFL